MPDNSYSLWNTIKKAGCTAAVISDITILCIRQSLAFTYYIKIYLRMKSTARIYMTGVIFSFFPAKRFMTT